MLTEVELQRAGQIGKCHLVYYLKLMFQNNVSIGLTCPKNLSAFMLKMLKQLH